MVQHRWTWGASIEAKVTRAKGASSTKREGTPETQKENGRVPSARTKANESLNRPNNLSNTNSTSSLSSK